MAFHSSLSLVFFNFTCEVIQCFSLSDLSHLASQASSFIHVVTNGRISFFLASEYCSIVCMFVCIIYIIHRYIYTYLTYFLIFFMHSSVDRHLDCFRVLNIVNNAAVNVGVWLSLWDHDFFCILPRRSRRKMAGSYRSSVLNFLKVKIAQLCPTLWDSMGYTVRGILQARILEWVAFPFSKGSSQPRDWAQVSHMAGGFFTSWATREALIFWEPFILFSIVATPISFPSTACKSSLFFTSLLTLTNLSSFW